MNKWKQNPGWLGGRLGLWQVYGLLTKIKQYQGKLSYLWIELGGGKTKIYILYFKHDGFSQAAGKSDLWFGYSLSNLLSKSG